jgi:hypothetical protein
MEEGEKRVGIAEDRVELEVDGAFSRDALYAAACTFTDRCFVRLEVQSSDQREDQGVSVVLRAKDRRGFDGPKLLQELRDELDGQAFRQRMVEGSRDFLQQVYGVSASPADAPVPAISVDDLRTFEGLGATEGTAEDPLALALRWEKKREGEAR